MRQIIAWDRWLWQPVRLPKCKSHGNEVRHVHQLFRTDWDKLGAWIETLESGLWHVPGGLTTS